MCRRLLLFLAAIWLSEAVAFAQVDDAAYCARLFGLAAKYVGASGGEGNKGPDLNTTGAMLDCRKGNYAKGIAYLEKRLREAGVTLPPR